MAYNYHLSGIRDVRTTKALYLELHKPNKTITFSLETFQ